MSPAKPADIRIYCDADVLGLAKLVCQIREDRTFPGDPGGRIRKRERPPCPITTATKDPDWSLWWQVMGG